VTEARARGIVRDRAGGRCEICPAPGSEWSHRVARGRGGTWAPSNGLWLCGICHRKCHAQPDTARANGWHLPTGTDPLDAPARIHPRHLWRDWWRLDDEGLYIPCEVEVGAT
jgi:5-methylcytosine-specific restriction protein A